MENRKTLISGLIERGGDRLLDEWLRLQRGTPGFRVKTVGLQPV